MPVYLRNSIMPAPVAVLSDWHFRAGALDRLIPPWMPVRLEQRPAAIAEGAVTRVRVGLGGMRFGMTARHHDVMPGAGFTDSQVEGPFAHWEHRHSFLPHAGGDPAQSVLEDRVEYALPGGKLGHLALAGVMAMRLDRAFTWRHQRIRHDLHHHAPFVGEHLRVAISGTTGLVGNALLHFLTTAGHDVRRIVRGEPDHARGDVRWDARANVFDARALEGLDAVVHLAGANIAGRRWTNEYKRLIRDSRVDGLRALAGTLAKLHQPPRVLICASAVGFYGARDPDEVLTEESAPGEGFLPETCLEYEAAAAPAAAAGIRVVHLRIGLVLSMAGGGLPKLYRPFSLGMGGPVGNGRQMISWIALDDLLGVIRTALSRPIAGAVNAATPNPVSNAQLTAALGRVLRRPAFMPLPAPVVRALFGQMGQALLLDGARMMPARLQELGFRWTLPRLEEALAFELGRPVRNPPASPETCV